MSTSESNFDNFCAKMFNLDPCVSVQSVNRLNLQRIEVCVDMLRRFAFGIGNLCAGVEADSCYKF